jgi:hypothetical protein
LTRCTGGFASKPTRAHRPSAHCHPRAPSRALPHSRSRSSPMETSRVALRCGSWAPRCRSRRRLRARAPRATHQSRGFLRVGALRGSGGVEHSNSFERRGGSSGCVHTGEYPACSQILHRMCVAPTEDVTPRCARLGCPVCWT